MPTTVVLNPSHPERALSVALEALQRDELVVVPTETVYGVAARRSARAALDELKGSRRTPYSLALPSLDSALGLVSEVHPPARRAAARWWPGPLTLVLADPTGAPIGLRVPGHPFTRALVSALGEPVLLPSANRSGEPAPCELAQVGDGVRTRASVLVDGGRCALGEASTVLACGPSVVALLREGVVSRQEVSRLALGRVLVVCSGNTCRSPMARALLERELAARLARDDRLLVPHVESAGVFAGPGQSASRTSQSVMAARGLDLSEHSSRALDQQLSGPLDRILCMTQAHRATVLELLGAASDRVEVELFDPLGHEVSDPFGGSLAEYETCANMLAAMAARRADALMPTLGTNP